MSFIVWRQIMEKENRRNPSFLERIKIMLGWLKEDLFGLELDSNYVNSPNLSQEIEELEPEAQSIN
jgi:hypothetical protein